MTQISKKYTILFHKYDTFHNLLNAKLIYSPILLQELSKFHYMTISENNDGGVGDMEFPWFFFFFFANWGLFNDHSRITGLQRKGKGISLTPH